MEITHSSDVTESLCWTAEINTTFCKLQINYGVARHACSIVSNSFVTPWTIARQAPLSMGFPKQEYRSGLPWPPPEDLPDTGVKHVNKKVSFLQLYHEDAVLLETKIHTEGNKGEI